MLLRTSVEKIAAVVIRPKLLPSPAVLNRGGICAFHTLCYMTIGRFFEIFD